MTDIQTRQTIVDYTEALAGIQFKSDNGLEDYMALKRDLAEVIVSINSGAVGATTFTGLTDTPADYAGAAGQTVLVNEIGEISKVIELV